jgi:Alw26I/Eco31I/Esp3I family type II restriction m6 adenine DNA methyltransferase
VLEGGSFAEVDSLQRTVAEAALRCDHNVDGVPLWATQLALYALALRLSSNLHAPGVHGFTDFARKCAEYGSRVFPDNALWPADAIGVAEGLNLLSKSDDGHLLMLVGRTLDYGRTLEWSVKKNGMTADRNLVTAKSQGIFYTPAFIARHLAARCIESSTREGCPRVCDPAVGGGIFLLASAENLLEHFDPKTVRHALYGTDTDPVAVEVTAILVDALCKAWRPGEVPELLNSNLLIGDAFGGPVMVDGPALPGAVNWRSSFPEIFGGECPGFDIVLVNPPFGRHKIDSDWLIAKEMKLDRVLLDDLRSSGRKRALDLRNSGYFPMSSTGVLDKSRIGLERAMQLTADGGHLGAVVPSTIAADNHSVLLRRGLIEQWEISEIDEFPETARLFFDVSQSISILHAKKGSPTRAVRVRSGLHFEGDLDSEFTAEWPVTLLSQISPKLAIPLRATDPRRVLERIHRHPTLKELSGMVNARGEVDVSAFENALTDDADMIPLVRGDQIDCFRSDLPSEKKSFVDGEQFALRLARSRKYDHFQRERVVGRQCSYLYRHKRLSFAHVAPEHAVANSCNYLSMDGEPDLLLYLLGLLNSSLLNWRFKVTNSNNHVANSELAELPVPDPARSPDSLVTEICNQARRLSDDLNDGDRFHLDELVFELYGLTGQQARFVTSAEVP